MIDRCALTTIAAVLVAGAVHARAQPLDRTEKQIVAAVERGLPRAIEELAQAVDVPSATENLAGVRRVGELYAAQLRDLGFATRWVSLPPEMGRAGHLVAEREGTKGRRVLLIGHLDTVIEGAPFRRSGDRATGSGTSDMKGGNAIVVAALRALHETGALRDRTVRVVFTGDEEAPGRPVEVARAALVDAARRSDVALAFEGAVGDTATIGRRGVTTWRLSVTGVGAHSSGIFNEEVGAAAAFECARILAAWYDALREPNLTFNPSLVLAGTSLEHDAAKHEGRAGGKSNITAKQAVAAGDLRFLTLEQRELAKTRMREIAARSLPRTAATLEFSDSYPPMAPNEASTALLGELDQVSRALGHGPVPALDPGLRGAGDVSFVAHIVPSLDGIGAAGDGAHTPDEHVELAVMPKLVTRTALLIYRLTHRGQGASAPTRP